jgi:hypothetical protein
VDALGVEHPDVVRATAARWRRLEVGAEHVQQEVVRVLLVGVAREGLQQVRQRHAFIQADAEVREVGQLLLERHGHGGPRV